MNCLKSLLSKNGAMIAKTEAGLEATTGATGGAGVRIRDIAGAKMEVLLPLVGAGSRAFAASLSLPIGKGFRQKLWRAGDLAIALAR